MPRYFLPAHVYVCAVQDQGFFLDLKRNEYLSAPLDDLKRLSQVVQGWPVDLGTCEAGTGTRGESLEGTVLDLTRNHLISIKPSRGRKPTVPPCPPARRSLLEQGITAHPPIFSRHLPSFLKAALIAKYFLSVRSLYSTVRRMERRRARNAASPHSFDLPTTRSLVEIFRRLRPLLPPTRTPCLLNSVVLLEFLAAHGQFPRFVFGVQGHPFSAHCWVQHGDTVLNSTLADVVKFTPIMIA